MGGYSYVSIDCVTSRGCDLGRCFVRVRYYVSQVVVDMECGDRVVRAYRGANEDVAMNTVRSSCFRQRGSSFQGGASYTSAIEFRSFLFLWSVAEGS